MIGKHSRYQFPILFQSKTGEYLGLRSSIDASPRPDNRFHTVVQGDRVDTLAYRYLGDAELWWVICDYNDLFFPLELQNGMTLRIPSKSFVMSFTS